MASPCFSRLRLPSSYLKSISTCHFLPLPHLYKSHFSGCPQMYGAGPMAAHSVPLAPVSET